MLYERTKPMASVEHLTFVHHDGRPQAVFADVVHQRAILVGRHGRHQLGNGMGAQRWLGHPSIDGIPGRGRDWLVAGSLHGTGLPSMALSARCTFAVPGTIPVIDEPMLPCSIPTATSCG